MGTCVNPGNEGFSEARSGTYVDKSGLIGLLNDRVCRDPVVLVSPPAPSQAHDVVECVFQAFDVVNLVHVVDESRQSELIPTTRDIGGAVNPLCAA